MPRSGSAHTLLSLSWPLMARMWRWMLWAAQLKEHRGFQTSRAVQYEAYSETPPKNAAGHHCMLRLHASHQKCYVRHQNIRNTLTSHSHASNHLLCCSEWALHQQGVFLHPKTAWKLLEVSNYKKLCVNSANPSMILSGNSSYTTSCASWEKPGSRAANPRFPNFTPSFK